MVQRGKKGFFRPHGHTGNQTQHLSQTVLGLSKCDNQLHHVPNTTYSEIESSMSSLYKKGRL